MRNYTQSRDIVAEQIARSKAASYLGGANDLRCDVQVYAAARALQAVFEIADINAVANELFYEIDERFEDEVNKLRRNK